MDWSSFLKGVGDALGPSDEHVRTLPFNSATNIKHSTHSRVTGSQGIELS